MPGRILFIDAYDSFTNNIVNLLRHSLFVTVEVIRIDDPRFVFNDDAFQNFLNKFDAVVAGPGPGHPGNVDDVGLIGKLWHLPNDCLLPVFGICLGFQSLALAFGAQVERLKQPRHGLVTPVTHIGSDIFSGIGDVVATQYHSLHVRLSQQAHASAESGKRWSPTRKCPELVPLAWDLSSDVNGPVLMATRHCHKPFWGVQYHPESICSVGGSVLLQSWWREVCRWNGANGRTAVSEPNRVDSPIIDAGIEHKEASSLREVCWTSVGLPDGVDLTDVVEMLKEGQACEPLVLESGVRNGKPVNPETGRYSMLGLHDQLSKHIRWSAVTSQLTITSNGDVLKCRQANIEEAFRALEAVMDQHKATGGPEAPFWGGLVGFISYEAGLNTIIVPPAHSESAKPDVWFVLVERSVIIDHVEGIVYVQTTKDKDDAWLRTTRTELLRLAEKKTCNPLFDPLPAKSPGAIISGPSKSDYCRKVSECQAHLRAGSSYELCLTEQTLVRTTADAWSLYRRLRQANPAPFGAYLSLNADDNIGVRVVGSSPERFLSWSRAGCCQFRPIKGTVKKMPGIGKAEAEVLLGSAKERAENLMIVDLIRHDLGGVAGVQNVRVPKLMVVEEYETVFQLVSVIEGDMESLPPSTAALAHSVPPGSMTGAPKKRSCELLKEVENLEPRGLYSGVIGYLDVGGGGDFSVVIRTAFKWEDEGDIWRIGAGGAVTVLSEPEAEWEEMLAKRQSVLDVLLASPNR